jgi:TolB-like protein/Flp pilus assembly protein TadD
MASTRRLAAIVAADVAGYTRLMGADEEGTHERLTAHLTQFVHPKLEEHRGRVVKNTGDGFLAEFPSVVDAVRCAAEVQQGMAKRQAEVPDYRRIRFRIGVNLGDVIVEQHDIFGDGVNIAARLEALAEPGGICVSGIVHDQVRDKLDLAFEDMGNQQVKNIARPVHAWRLRLGEKSTALPTTTPRLPDKPSIAVLPFANLSGDPDQEYFADGMVEEIITALSCIRWLFVMARNSSFTYKGQAVDVKQVARELGVRYVLEGSVRKVGNRVRITAQLIDTATGANIWADRFDSSPDDIFELQDQVASSVAGVIEPTLRKVEFERASRKPTESLDAYDLCLRALALRDQRSAESVYEAIGLLKQALAIDPNYASAKALVGWFLANETANGRRPVSQGEVAEAIALAKQALDTGKDDPDTLSMAAFTLSFFGGEHEIAATAVDRALAFNPNSAHAWLVCGLVRCYRGQPDPAIEAFQQAMRLSPLDRLGRLFTCGIAVAHLVAGRYEEAADWADRTLRQAPGHTITLLSKAVACVHLDRIKEARAAVSEVREVQPWLTIAWIRAAATRYPPELRARYTDGLRKAGMPEQ